MHGRAPLSFHIPTRPHQHPRPGGRDPHRPQPPKDTSSAPRVGERLASLLHVALGGGTPLHSAFPRHPICTLEGRPSAVLQPSIASFLHVGLRTERAPLFTPKPRKIRIPGGKLFHPRSEGGTSSLSGTTRETPSSFANSQRALSPTVEVSPSPLQDPQGNPRKGAEKKRDLFSLLNSRRSVLGAG